MLPLSSDAAFEIRGKVRESVGGKPIPNAAFSMDGKIELCRTNLDGDFRIWFDRDTVCGKKIWVYHPNYDYTYLWVPWVQEVPDKYGFPSEIVTLQMDIEMGMEVPAFKLNEQNNPWGHYQWSRYKKKDSISVSLEFCPSGYIPAASDITISGVNVTPTQISESKFAATLPFNEIYKASWIIVSADRDTVEIPISNTCPMLDYVIKLPPVLPPKPVGFQFFNYPDLGDDIFYHPREELMYYPLALEGELPKMERIFNEAFLMALKGYKTPPKQNLTVYARLNFWDRGMGSFSLFLPNGKPLDDERVKDAIREAWAEVKKSVFFLTPTESMVIFLGFEGKKRLFGK